jgi:hypothetical protein
MLISSESFDTSIPTKQAGEEQDIKDSSLAGYGLKGPGNCTGLMRSGVTTRA